MIDRVKPEWSVLFEPLFCTNKQLATMGEPFSQTLPQKMLSYARCLSNAILVTLIYPIYKDVVDEVVRWNVALKGLALSREARSQ